MSTSRILRNYGDIAVLWWDTPVNMNVDRAETLLPLIKLQPGMITNNRLHKHPDYVGDTQTPEGHVPASGISGPAWETCMTINSSWGYKSYDDNWKSSEVLIRNLIDIASKGGNYLLNVGPNAKGRIPQPAVDRLHEVGKWMDINHAAIYGTTKSQFAPFEWGRCTTKETAGGALLYLHVFDWPENRLLELPGLKNKIKKAWMIDGGETLKTEQTMNNRMKVHLPEQAAHPIATVVVVEVEGPLLIEDHRLPRQNSDGSILLSVGECQYYNPRVYLPGKYASAEKQKEIFRGVEADLRAVWDFEVEKGGTFELIARIKTSGAGIALKANSGGQHLAAARNEAAKEPADISLGHLTLKPGVQTLELICSKEEWHGVTLEEVKLLPIEL